LQPTEKSKFNQIVSIYPRNTCRWNRSIRQKMMMNWMKTKTALSFRNQTRENT